MIDRSAPFSAELLAALCDHIATSEPIHTLATTQPNWVTAITSEGLWVDTEKSRALGTGPQKVPAWMFETAWQRLTSRGRLTNRELLATDDLNVKRSSLVCAVLAQLPDVSVQSYQPIVLKYQR